MGLWIRSQVRALPCLLGDRADCHAFVRSYTTFSYAPLALSSTTVKPGQDLNVTVQVTNTGSRKGREAVLLFLSGACSLSLFWSCLAASPLIDTPLCADEYRIVEPEVKLLKAFDKFMINPQQTITRTFTLKT